MDLLNIVIGFIGVLMLGTILQWIDGKALRLELGQGNPQRWFLWAKREAFVKETGIPYTYYLLMIRLPAYTWGYAINRDDFQWMQRAIIWTNRRSDYPPKGLCLWEVEPMEQLNG